MVRSVGRVVGAGGARCAGDCGERTDEQSGQWCARARVRTSDTRAEGEEGDRSSRSGRTEPAEKHGEYLPTTLPQAEERWRFGLGWICDVV